MKRCGCEHRLRSVDIVPIARRLIFRHLTRFPLFSRQPFWYDDIADGLIIGRLVAMSRDAAHVKWRRGGVTCRGELLELHDYHLKRRVADASALRLP